tara:strand:+ start:689 stop:1315 length:627 start_codon:yes stop_codon:yes gene_type:complete
MKVLVACEESQAVCVAFRSWGHEAFSCDVQDCSGEYPDWHIKGDALKEAYSGKYDMMIAFPPCTYLSRAAARFMFPKGELNKERYNKALEAKAFFMSLLNAPIKHIAIENPTQFRMLNMPQYTQAIQPHMFGHPYSKRTLLWLKNLPPLIPTKHIEKHTPFVKSSSHRGSYQPPTKTAKERSKTFEGIARAMASQWHSPSYWEQLQLF